MRRRNHLPVASIAPDTMHPNAASPYAMHPIRALAIAVALLLGFACAPSGHAPTEADSAGNTSGEASAEAITSCEGCLVLRQATVVDVRAGRHLADRTVILRDGRILAIETSTASPPPTGAQTIDLDGAYVLPGLIDMHAHVAIMPGDEKGRLLDEIDQEQTEQVLRTLLAFGITTIRNPAALTAEGVALREAVASGELLGPRIRTAGHALNRRKATFGPFAATPDAASIEQEIARQAALGVDYIKVYAWMPPKLIATAIEAAHDHGLEVIGHLQRTTWTEAARLGIDHITHGAPWSATYLPKKRRAGYRGSFRDRMTWLEAIELDGPQITEMVTALVENKVSIDPTLIVYETKFRGDLAESSRRDDLTFAPAPMLEQWRRGSFVANWSAKDFARGHRVWDRALALIKKLYDGGVHLTAGSDMPNPWVIPGASLHEELQLLASAGIPPAAVLRMATIDAARSLHLDDRIGTIEVGKDADLVILDADPLADLANTRTIRHVVVKGKVFSPDDLLE